jgi:hypothetical protein
MHYLQDTDFFQHQVVHPSAHSDTDVLLYDYTVSVGTVWGILEPQSSNAPSHTVPSIIRYLVDHWF